MPMAEILNPKTKKIYGFDRWDVKDAARTLKEAEEVKKKSPKFLKAVQMYVDMEAETAKVAATKLRAVTKVQKKMDKVYGNPHPKGGY